MIKLVLFDIDGTLVLTGGAGQKAFSMVCEKEFNTPNGTDKIQFAGRTDPSIVRQFFELHHIEPLQESFDKFFSSYVFWLDQMLKDNEGEVLPGIHRLINQLRSQANPPIVGLLTGNIRIGARMKLSHYQLWDYFQMGAYGDDHEDRNALAKVAQERGSHFAGHPLKGEEIVVIGDTPRDIECAQGIQAKCLAVATGSYSMEDLEDHEPTWLVESLEEFEAETLQE